MPLHRNGDERRGPASGWGGRLEALVAIPQSHNVLKLGRRYLQDNGVLDRRDRVDSAELDPPGEAGADHGLLQLVFARSPSQSEAPR